MDPIWLIHLTPVVMMVTILTLNHRVNGRKSQRRSSLEASRLATALSVELQSMLSHYSENLTLLAQEAPILLSGRGIGQVYRSNSARLVTALDDRVIAAVVAAYAHHERAEAMLTACTQPNSHHTLRAGAGGAYHDRLRDTYRSGCETVEAALSALALAWPVAGSLDASESAPALAAPDDSVVSLGRTPA
jgi:hypothetical protein